MSWRSILLVGAVGILAACSSDGAAPETGPTVAPSVTSTLEPAPAGSSPPGSAPSGSSQPGPVVPVGFAARAGRVTAADGTVCEVCLWIAATPEERSRGLMGVTDLGGADGMAFLWDEPTQGQFWMRDTPMPLSIAFFAADGSYVSSVDMVPCLDGPDADCARYQASGPYTTAIEVPSGGLGAIAVGPGSRLELLDLPCDPVSG